MVSPFAPSTGTATSNIKAIARARCARGRYSVWVISWLVCSKGIRRASGLAGRVLSVRILGLILIRNQDVIWVLGRVAVGNLIVGMRVESTVFRREAEGGKGRESGVEGP